MPRFLLISLIILIVRFLFLFKTKPYKGQLTFIFKFCDQPVFVMSDIKHDPAVSNSIRILEKPDHFVGIPEAVFFDSVVPKFQRRFASGY